MNYFTAKQDAALDKCLNEGYLNGMIPDEQIAWLKTMDPKNIYDAHSIIECIFKIAYRKGVVSLVQSDIMKEIEEAKNLLTSIYKKYE